MKGRGLHEVLMLELRFPEGIFTGGSSIAATHGRDEHPSVEWSQL